MVDETLATPKTMPVEDALTVDTFDLEKWINGVTPVERACTIYGRADLLAQLDLMRDRIRAARRAGKDTKSLEGQAQHLADEVEASALDVVVQGWSPERREEYHQALKDQGITDNLELGLHMVAAQIVKPEGFTVEMLRTLQDVSPTQAGLIASRVQEANTKPVEVSVPF